LLGNAGVFFRLLLFILQILNSGFPLEAGSLRLLDPTRFWGSFPFVGLRDFAETPPLRGFPFTPFLLFPRPHRAFLFLLPVTTLFNIIDTVDEFERKFFFPLEQIAFFTLVFQW